MKNEIHTQKYKELNKISAEIFGFVPTLQIPSEVYLPENPEPGKAASSFYILSKDDGPLRTTERENEIKNTCCRYILCLATIYDSINGHKTTITYKREDQHKNSSYKGPLYISSEQMKYIIARDEGRFGLAATTDKFLAALQQFSDKYASDKPSETTKVVEQTIKQNTISQADFKQLIIEGALEALARHDAGVSTNKIAKATEHVLAKFELRPEQLRSSIAQLLEEQLKKLEGTISSREADKLKKILDTVAVVESSEEKPITKISKPTSPAVTTGLGSDVPIAELRFFPLPISRELFKLNADQLKEVFHKPATKDHVLPVPLTFSAIRLSDIVAAGMYKIAMLPNIGINSLVELNTFIQKRKLSFSEYENTILKNWSKGFSPHKSMRLLKWHYINSINTK